MVSVHTALKLLISIITGPAVNHSDKMDMQRTEALGANYAGGNNHLIALSKNQVFFLSHMKSREIVEPCLSQKEHTIHDKD